MRYKNARRSYRRWSDEETEYLTNNYGLVTMVWMCRRLGRSKGAIQVRAVKLGVNRKSNYLNASEAARQMGVNSTTIRAWIDRGLLKGRKSHNGHENKKWWLIMPGDLELFVRTQVTIYDPRLVTNPYLRRLAQKHVPKGTVPKLVRVWTPEEDAFLMNNHKQLTYRQIGEKLKRTKEAVHGRMVLLRKQHGRKISYKGPWIPGVGQKPRWTEEDDEYLRQHWPGRIKGKQKKDPNEHRLTVDDMCAHLGRTEHAVYTRARYLGLASPWERKDRPRKRDKAA